MPDDHTIDPVVLWNDLAGWLSCRLGDHDASDPDTTKTVAAVLLAASARVAMGTPGMTAVVYEAASREAYVEGVLLESYETEEALAETEGWPQLLGRLRPKPQGEES